MEVLCALDATFSYPHLTRWTFKLLLLLASITKPQVGLVCHFAVHLLRMGSHRRDGERHFGTSDELLTF